MSERMHQRMIEQTDKWMNGRTNDIMGIIKTKLHFLFINIANLLLNLVCNNVNVDVQFVNVNVNIENTATEFNVCPQYPLFIAEIWEQLVLQ